MAHVHTEVVAEMVSQVGESPCRALEVCARHLHPLDTEHRSVGLWIHIQALTRVCVFLTSSDTLLSMAPNIECRAPTESQELLSEVNREQVLLYTFRKYRSAFHMCSSLRFPTI